jgi:hypothetical protein
MTRRLTAAVLAIPLLLSACDGGSSDELPLVDLADAAAIVWCNKAYKCCTDEELKDYSFNNPMECRTMVGVAVDQYMVKPMQDAIASGRGEYDGKNAMACLEAFQVLGCTGTNDPNEFFANCQSPWTARQTDGEPCASWVECVAGSYCSEDTSHCVTFAAENQACTPEQDPYCGAQFYCDGTTCLKRKPEDSTCTTNLECALGTECTMGTCTLKELSCTGRS